VVLSRNLTFDRSWDTALTFDGRLLDRQRGLAENRPLAEFIGALPGMAERAGIELPAAALTRSELMADEVRRVRWETPDGFDTYKFHPIGHRGKAAWPITGFHRLLVISPFTSERAIRRLRAEAGSEFSIVSRFETLAALDPALFGDDSVDVFDELSAAVDADGQAEGDDDAEQADGALRGELTGLHAKLFVGKRGRRAVVFVGSANATDAAFDHNVEFVVELEGSEAATGIDRVYTPLAEAGLLRPFRPGETAIAEDETAGLQRQLERAAHLLAAGAMRASATGQPDGRWVLALHVTREIDLGGLRLHARPLLQSDMRAVDLGASPAVTFRSSELLRVTAFFVLELSDPEQRVPPLDITARLPLDGAPNGRIEAVTADMLSRPELLLRFILVLLSRGGETDRFLGDLNGALAEGGAGGSALGVGRSDSGLPLLEPMLRTLHRAPERLSEVESLLADLRRVQTTVGSGLPAELDALWQTITAVRSERA
jgi:hypothetical protein